MLQLPSGESGSNILRRPLQYLYPLELDCKRDDGNRPKRAAAQKANDFIKAVISDDTY